MRICIVAEGCYPYVVGGVSSWIHSLIRSFPGQEFVILAIVSDRSMRGVPYAQISFVEVIGKHLYLHLTDGNIREVAGALKNFEAILLPRPEFMRVHRSYIVNMFQVEELSSSGLRTFQGDSLPVSRLFYPQIQKDYMALLFERKGGGK